MVSTSDRPGCPLAASPDTGSGSRAGGILRHGLGLSLPVRGRRRCTARKRCDANPAPERRPATGPFPPPAWLPAGADRHRGRGFLRWLGQAVRPKGPRDLPAEQCRCLASSFVSPHVTAKPRRPSSRLARDVFEPSGSGSGVSMARWLRVGMKWGDSCGLSFSPLVGENAKS